MALPTSGNSISFLQIKNEFGIPPGFSFGAYRVQWSNTASGGSLVILMVRNLMWWLIFMIKIL